MSQTVTVTDTDPLLSAAEIEMRNTSGLTRRTFAAQEEGEAGDKGDYIDDLKVLTTTTLPPSAYRDAIRYMNKCGSRVFIVAVVAFFLGSLRSGRFLRAQNTFFNFLHLYLHIALMVGSIMGLMHAMKIDSKIE
jgi:hypothetical protein